MSRSCTYWHCCVPTEARTYARHVQVALGKICFFSFVSTAVDIRKGISDARATLIGRYCQTATETLFPIGVAGNDLRRCLCCNCLLLLCSKMSQNLSLDVRHSCIACSCWIWGHCKQPMFPL